MDRERKRSKNIKGTSAVCLAVLVVSLVSWLGAVSAYAEKLSEKDGLVRENGHTYYYEEGRRLTNSWVTAGEDTYYFRWDGQACELSCQIGKEYYVFDSKGRLQQPSAAGLVKVKTKNGETKQYYVDEEGAAISGWSKDRKYYYHETGEMAVGAAMLNGRFYYFRSKGKYDEQQTKKLRNAAKYEQPFAALKKIIGKPEKAAYYPSCYGKGKDGILTYKTFQIYTFRPDQGQEIFMGAE